MYLNAAGGLLAGLLLFSCSTEELVENASAPSSIQSKEEQTIYMEQTLANILARNIEEQPFNTTPLNESITLTSSNTSYLTLSINEYCGYKPSTNEVTCTTDFFKIGGLSDDRVNYSSSSYANNGFYDELPNPYTSNLHGGYTSIYNRETDSYAWPLTVQFTNGSNASNDREVFYRYEHKAETNDIISPIIFPGNQFNSKSLNNNITDFDNNIYNSDNHNIYLKDLSTDNTVAVIGYNVPYMTISDNGFHWKIPSTIPSGEYYVYIEDSKNSTIHTSDQYITKTIITNNGELDDALVNLDANNVITSPSDLYFSNTGINTTWDYDSFSGKYVKITFTTFDFSSFPFVQVQFDDWVLNNGSYTIEGDFVGSAVLAIQTVSEATGKQFVIIN